MLHRQVIHTHHFKGSIRPVDVAKVIEQYSVRQVPAGKKHMHYKCTMYNFACAIVLHVIQVYGWISTCDDHPECMSGVLYY